MKNDLKIYNKKRNFNNTKEPLGLIYKTNNKHRFCIQHHLASKDHFDLRLEYNNVMLSWAVPKGLSYNSKDKRLAIKVENHPLSYRNFEGIIPKNNYGAGTVMLWDKGYFKEIEKFKTTYPKGYLKFFLNGQKCIGSWTLIKMKDNNWLIIKEKDEYQNYKNLNKLDWSVKSNLTMNQIKKQKNIIITNPNKIIYQKLNITKKDIINYYQKVYPLMKNFLDNHLISTVRAPKGIPGPFFYKKHFKENKYLKKYHNSYYINDLNGLLNECQLNSIEYHIWTGNIKERNKPNIIVFDLDPDENLSIEKIRKGVKDLKKILDNLKLKSYLKTSGGKGYHILVPLKNPISWTKAKHLSHNIALLMEKMNPDKYTSKISKKYRHNKIFIDWMRNIKGSTFIAPYSLRINENATVSFPIKWSSLDKIKPNDINLKSALKKINNQNPWNDFFN